GLVHRGSIMSLHKILRGTWHGVVCLAICGLPALALGREWMDASGKFKIEAELVAVRNGKAILEKPDGSVITVPVDKLSPADQEFLRAKSGPSPASAKPEAGRPAALVPVANATTPFAAATPAPAAPI